MSSLMKGYPETEIDVTSPQRTTELRHRVIRTLSLSYESEIAAESKETNSSR